MRVLLIDDDPLVRMALSDTLSEEGIEVDGLDNAEDALILLAAGQVPDVLVTDVVLGNGLSGLDLVTLARERHPAVEVILMSGKPLPEHQRHRAHERFLQKPFAPEALIDAVHEAVRDAPGDDLG